MTEGGLGACLLAVAGSELSSLWRIELLHPAVVHFPVALTLVGSGFWLLGVAAARWARLSPFRLSSLVLLCLAAVSAWAAVQTGLWADEVVGRELFDPRPLKDHENNAFIVAWLLTAAALADLLRRSRLVPAWGRTLGPWLVAGLLVAACGVLAYVAHLGASLVYQQGAGVIMPGAGS
jgi:uncharacterized membrane protein